MGVFKTTSAKALTACQAGLGVAATLLAFGLLPPSTATAKAADPEVVAPRLIPVLTNFRDDGIGLPGLPPVPAARQSAATRYSGPGPATPGWATLCTTTA